MEIRYIKSQSSIPEWESFDSGHLELVDDNGRVIQKEDAWDYNRAMEVLEEVKNNYIEKEKSILN